MPVHQSLWLALTLFSIEVEELRDDVLEEKSKLESTQERLREINAQKQETKAAIANAQRIRHIQKSSTRAEVFRLKGIYCPCNYKWI